MNAATLTPPVGYARPAVPWNGLTVTDLFCGAGGSSSGLVEAGYRVVLPEDARAVGVAGMHEPPGETNHDLRSRAEHERGWRSLRFARRLHRDRCRWHA